MNSMELVRFPTRGARPTQGATKKSPPFCSELISPVRNAIVRARHLLVTRQRSDGAWLGWQGGAVSLLSQLVFLLAYSEREDSELAQQCAAAIRYEQRPDGGWSSTSDGSADINASVQAYFALKLTGHDPTDTRMRQARERIRKLGGVDATDFETRYFLALLGQLDYDYCEPVSPEGICYRGSVSRLRVPMSIVWSHRPVRKIAMEHGVRELFLSRPCDWPVTCAARHDSKFNRRTNSLFRTISRFVEQRGWTPLRPRAMNRAESQLSLNVDPIRISELSFRDLVWHEIALHTIGYDVESPELRICEEKLNDLVDIDEESGLASPRFRNGKRHDSALMIRSLVASGMSPNHPAIDEGLGILCQPEAITSSLSTTTACNVIEALHHCRATEADCDLTLPPDIDVRWDWQYTDVGAEQITDGRREQIEDTLASCIERLLNDQNRDGGWNDATDLREPKQPSEPDATGAAIESLARGDGANVQLALNRGRQFLRSRQLGDGSWAMTDGTQQVLCTSAALRGLLAADVPVDDDCIAAAVNWLVIQQQPSGAWQDSATQTAWAVLGLIAAKRVDHPAVRRGIEFLLDSQDEEGGWGERRSVLRDPDSNHWFRNYLHSTAWPLLALSRFAVAASSSQSSAADEMSLRLVAAAVEN